jgi:hypothetical protein
MALHQLDDICEDQRTAVLDWTECRQGLARARQRRCAARARTADGAQPRRAGAHRTRRTPRDPAGTQRSRPPCRCTSRHRATAPTTSCAPSPRSPRSSCPEPDHRLLRHELRDLPLHPQHAMACGGRSAPWSASPRRWACCSGASVTWHRALKAEGTHKKARRRRLFCHACPHIIDPPSAPRQLATVERSTVGGKTSEPAGWKLRVDDTVDASHFARVRWHLRGKLGTVGLIGLRHGSESCKGGQDGNSEKLGMIS